MRFIAASLLAGCGAAHATRRPQPKRSGAATEREIRDAFHAYEDATLAADATRVKTIRNAVRNPGWRELADETLNEYADRYCDRVEDLPDDATRRDFDRLDWAILDELYDEGELSWRDAQNLKARRA